MASSDKLGKRRKKTPTVQTRATIISDLLKTLLTLTSDFYSSFLLKNPMCFLTFFWNKGAQKYKALSFSLNDKSDRVLARKFKVSPERYIGENCVNNKNCKNNEK